jgi:hypothetical protein
MKPTESVALATWILEHLTFGSHNEALAGDLLEELRRGRSAVWYWRQVLSAIRVSAVSQFRDYALPLAFSAGWSMFYPVWWLYIERSQLARTMFERWVALDWPYSTSWKLAGGIIPVVTFLWLGFFVYLMSHRELAPQLSKLQLLGSLSISLNVLLVGLLIHFKHPGIDVGYVTRESLYANSHLVAISMALALSLLSAISSSLPTVRRPHRGIDSVAGT